MRNDGRNVKITIKVMMMNVIKAIVLRTTEIRCVPAFMEVYNGSGVVATGKIDSKSRGGHHDKPNKS